VGRVWNRSAISNRPALEKLIYILGKPKHWVATEDFDLSFQKAERVVNRNAKLNLPTSKKSVYILGKPKHCVPVSDALKKKLVQLLK